MGLPESNTSISLASFQAMICETDNIEEEIAKLKDMGIDVGKIDRTPWGSLPGLRTWMETVCAFGKSSGYAQQRGILRRVHFGKRNNS